MSFNNIYEVSSSALNAQTIRMNAISSNLANVDSIAGSREEAYKPLKPVFAAQYNKSLAKMEQASVPVQVADIVEIDSLVEGRFEPENPLADKDGYVYYSGINVVNEMADMMSATRSFEANAEVINNVKSMQQSLLRVWEL
ncbi:flagellar basal body rod protein FlgC [Vibrio barjaei]|uniref:flagellar basal body rod protein FlgC n=1 Tax=Vibrio barjaei TaxID=1676683 RepID=UPI002284EBA1|nr:flagellar basal body rod protein FlgC [Vibrio barjaei]MCY9872319.1 flagellar basal body rod protein FlgC [Vibrio barjaei]